MPQITARFPDGHTTVANAKNPLPFAKAQFALRAVSVQMGEGDFEIDAAAVIQLSNFPSDFIGSGMRTVISITATTPAHVVLPGRTASPATHDVTTEVLGAYFTSQGGLCPFLRFGNFTLKGIIGTPAAPGHYKGFTVVAGEIEVLPIWQSHDHSQHYDPAVGLQAPYLAKSQRNILSEVGVHFGEDRWVEPDPTRCRPVGNIRFLPGGSLRGEPLQETSALSTAVGVVTPYAFRRCSGVRWPSHGIDFGEKYTSRSRVAGDLILGGVPAEDDTFLVGSEDPFTRAISAVTFRWTSNPQTPTDVQRGADGPACILAAVAAIQANRAGFGGTLWVEAKKPSEFLPFTTPAEQAALDTTAMRLRVQAMAVPSDVNVGMSSTLPYAPLCATIQVGVSNGGVMLAAPIHTANSLLEPGVARRGTWNCGLFFEDCFGNHIGSSSIGCDDFRRDVIAAYATTPNLLFIPDPWAERGHSVMQPWTGETNRMRCAVRIADAGWNTIDGPAFGLTNLRGTDGAGVKGFITIERGIHRATRMTFTGPTTDGGLFTLEDGSGGNKTFEFDGDANVTPGRIAVPIGVNAAATAENVRQAIFAQMDAHGLRCYPGVVIDAGGGVFTLDVTYFTETGEYTAMPTAVATATNVTITDPDPSALGTISAPWLPRYGNTRLNHHALGDGSLSSVCSFWCEGAQEVVHVSGNIDTLRAKLSPTLPQFATSSQAVRTLTIHGVPGGNATDVILDSIAAGGKGTPVAFKIRAGGGVDDPTNRFIDKTVHNSAGALAAALIAKINAAALDGANPRAFGAFLNSSVSPDGQIAPGVFAINVIDGADGVNNNLLTVVNGSPGDLVAAANLCPGVADPALSGKLSPIVGIDNRVLDVQGIKMSGFVANFVPAQLIYVERSSPGLTSRLYVGNNRCHSAMGVGRFGVDALISYGANMSAANVTNLGGNSVENVDGSVRVI